LSKGNTLKDVRSITGTSINTLRKLKENYCWYDKHQTNNMDLRELRDGVCLQGVCVWCRSITPLYIIYDDAPISVCVDTV
jgi:hypothetical protein